MRMRRRASTATRSRGNAFRTRAPARGKARCPVGAAQLGGAGHVKAQAYTYYILTMLAPFDKCLDLPAGVCAICLRVFVESGRQLFVCSKAVGISEVVGTAKSEYGQACTSGT